jgi:Na+/proline symporter
MALVVRILVILFGFVCASLAAAAVVISAVVFPQFTDIDLDIDDQTRSVIVAFGFIFVSGFALLPAMIMALITEAFAVRSLVFYAVGGALVGAACYLSIVPFDPDTFTFHGIVHRELEVMTGAGIVAGFVYWFVAGRSAGLWRRPPPPPPPPHMAPR